MDNRQHDPEPTPNLDLDLGRAWNLDLDLEGLGALGVDDALIAQRMSLDGHTALAFLAELPARVSHWQARLGLRDARIMPGGVLSAALACRRLDDGSPVVLKLSSPHAASARAEAAALASWGGVGACALLYAAEQGSVMLLDAIRPGTPVRPSDDEDADVSWAAGLLRNLHRVAPSQIPRAIPAASAELSWRFERAHQKLDGPSHARGLVGHHDLDGAHRAALDLDRECTSKVMCHGDFIAKNILIDARHGWRAIDPRPCVGDPCLDGAFWSLTHRPGEGVRQRCEKLARATGLDADRVWAWATAFAVSETVLVTDAPRARAYHRVVRS